MHATLGLDIDTATRCRNALVGGEHVITVVVFCRAYPSLTSPFTM